MSTEKRLRHIRKFRGMTQQQLGTAVGFPEKSADIRIAQYESGSRTPKEELNGKLAEVLNVSPAALNVPDIESADGVIHTLFALEDMYGFKIGRAEGKPALIFDGANAELQNALTEWLKFAAMAICGHISQEEYYNWKYNYRTAIAGNNI